MPTGQVVVSNVLTKLGLNNPSGTPGAGDSNYVLTELNTMWDGWSVDEGLIYAETTFSGNLTTTIPSYTIGTGAVFNTQRPSRIYKAFFVLGNNRNELTIVEGGKYYEHNDLTATAATPDELYPDYNVDPTTGYATLYLWPVPTFNTGAPTLQLLQAVPFKVWTLGGAYFIPQAYQDAIEWSVAFRCLPGFGAAVDPRIAEIVQAEALRAEARIREMNRFNRQVPEQAVMAPGSQPPPAKAA